jgi:hypothetical protein
MSIRNLLLFLVGNRQAILELAADRRGLAVGFLFVLSAGFAREYDGTDLLREPWHVLIPIGASLAASFLLFVIACGKMFFNSETRPSFLNSYLSFLTLFWMTAPLAWLYAIPYERFLPPGQATGANLWTLALVAAWRVLIMIRAIAVLTNISIIASGFLVMAFADGLALLAIRLMPKPVISFMGGVRLTESERVIHDATLMVSCWGILTAPLWVIGGIIALGMIKPVWQVTALHRQKVKSGRDMWGFAITSVLIWFVVLPFTQSEYRRTSNVERAMKEGRIADGLDIMSAHSRGDFPPLWDPPPRIGYGEDQPNVMDIMELISQRDDAEWVRQIYLSKFLLSFETYGPGNYRLKGQGNELVRLAKILSAIPEGPAIAAKLTYAIEAMNRQTSSLYEEERKSLKTLEELAEKVSPKPKEN